MTQSYALVKAITRKRDKFRNTTSLKIMSVVIAVLCFVFRGGLPVGFLLYSLLVESPLQMATICVVVFFIGVVFYGASNCWLLCFYVSEFKRRVLSSDDYFQKAKSKEITKRPIFKALPGVPRKLYGANLISELMKTSQTCIDIETAPYKMNNTVHAECNIHGGLSLTKNKI